MSEALSGHARFTQWCIGVKSQIFTSFDISYWHTSTSYLEKYLVNLSGLHDRLLEIRRWEGRWMWEKCPSLTVVWELWRCVVEEYVVQGGLIVVKHLQWVSDHQRLFCWTEDQLIVLYQRTALSKTLSRVEGRPTNLHEKKPLLSRPGGVPYTVDKNKLIRKIFFWLLTIITSKTAGPKWHTVHCWVCKTNVKAWGRPVSCQTQNSPSLPHLPPPPPFSAIGLGLLLPLC